MKQSKDCNIKSWQMRNPDKFVKWFHIYLYYIKRIILWLHEKLFIASFFWISFVCITTQYFHYNCQGRQDGLRRTLRDTVKQCFINPHHIYIYIRGGKRVPGVHRVREIQNVHTRSAPSFLIGYPSHTKLYASAGTMTITQPS